VADKRVGELAIPNLVPRLSDTPSEERTLGPELGVTKSLLQTWFWCSGLSRMQLPSFSHSQPRGTQRYRPSLRPDEDQLTQRIISLACQYGRYGYRRIAVMVNRSGLWVSRDRVERIWRREAL